LSHLSGRRSSIFLKDPDFVITPDRRFHTPTQHAKCDRFPSHGRWRILCFYGAFTAHNIVIPHPEETCHNSTKIPKKDRPPDRTTFQPIEHLTNWLINKMSKKIWRPHAHKTIQPHGDDLPKIRSIDT